MSVRKDGPRRGAGKAAIVAVAVVAAASLGFAALRLPALRAALGLRARPGAAVAAEGAPATGTAAPAGVGEAAAGRAGTANAAGAAGAFSAGVERIVEAVAATATGSIESTGNLEAARVADLSFRSAGIVAAIEVEVGSRVAAGAPLASLDDREARYRLADAELRLQSARVSGNQKQAELIALERGMRAADLEDTVLRAPFAGVVSAVDIEVGDSVAASTKAIRLLDRSSLKAVLDIDEIDLPQIKIGQRVVFTLDAFPKREYLGRVSLIPQEGTVTNQGLAVFGVEATIPAPPTELRPGYSFVATIEPAAAMSAVLIPSTALVERNGSMYVVVWKGEGRAPERRKVAATRKDDGNAEVTEGLEVGEKVAIPKAEASAQGGFNFRIPGIGGPPPGGQQQGNRAGAVRSRNASPAAPASGGGQGGGGRP